MTPAGGMGKDPRQNSLEACKEVVRTLRRSCQVHSAFCNFLGVQRSKVNYSLKPKSEYIPPFIDKWLKYPLPLLPSETEESEMQRRESTAEELRSAMESDKLKTSLKILSMRFGRLDMLTPYATAPDTMDWAKDQLRDASTDDVVLNAQKVLRTSVKNLKGKGQELSPVGHQKLIERLDTLRNALDQFGSRRGRPQGSHTAGPARTNKRRHAPAGQSKRGGNNQSRH